MNSWNFRVRKGANLIEDSLQCSCVVGIPVALRTLRFYTDKLRRGVVGICRATFADNPASTIQQRRGLRNRWNRRLYKSSCRIRAGIDIALCPRVDSGGPSCKHDRAACHTNSSGDIVELDVVQNQRPQKLSIAGQRGLHKHGRVSDHGVDDRFSLDSL